jgi:hypothetical protein
VELSDQPHNGVAPMSLTHEVTTTSFLRRHGGSGNHLADALEDAIHLYIDEMVDHDIGSFDRRERVATELGHFQHWLRNLKDRRLERAEIEVRIAAAEVRSEACLCRSSQRLLQALEERERLG